MQPFHSCVQKNLAAEGLNPLQQVAIRILLKLAPGRYFIMGNFEEMFGEFVI